MKEYEIYKKSNENSCEQLSKDLNLSKFKIRSLSFHEVNLCHKKFVPKLR